MIQIVPFAFNISSAKSFQHILEKDNMFLKIRKKDNPSLNIWEKDTRSSNLSLENKEINNLSWIYSHFKCQEMAGIAFQSVQSP